MISYYLIATLFLFSYNNVLEKEIKKESNYLSLIEGDKLVYYEDKKGNKIQDFSYLGYHSGEKPIPNISTLITLDPLSGDNT